MASPQDMISQFIGVVKGLSMVQKIIFGILIVVVLGVLFNLSMQGPGADHKVLFSGMAEDDAAAVVAKLQEFREPYQLANNGTSIKVPGDRVHEVRLRLAGEGLPRGGGVGFEIFDKSSFGATDFVQRLNYQRALQGELARTISQIDQVVHARVHIAAPKETVFIEEEKKPSASVIVKLRGREKLPSHSIKAIVNLVGSAVPGLTADNITVVDTAGRLLFRQESGQDALLSASQLEYQIKIEETLRKKVESMLEEVVGFGRAQARITADIDFNRINITEESFDPEGQVVRSEQLQTEEDLRGGEQAEGIPGVKGNLATFAEDDEGGGAAGQSHKRNNVTRNFEISRTTRHVQSATGLIKKLSVAVMIDGTYQKVKDDDGNASMQYQPRSADELQSFEKIVRNAIGYDEERGDQVEVVGVPFALSSIVEPEVSAIAEWTGVIEKFVKPLVVVLVLIVLIMFVVRPLFRMIAEKQAESEATVARVERGTVATSAEEEEDLSLSPKKMTDKERIYKLAQSDPGRAADLVRRWLREEM